MGGQRWLAAACAACLLGAVLGGGGRRQPVSARLHRHVLQLASALSDGWTAGREDSSGAPGQSPFAAPGRRGAARTLPVLIEDMLQLQLLQRGLHGGCSHGESPGCPDLRSRPPQLAKRSSITSGAPWGLRAFQHRRRSAARAVFCLPKSAPPALRDPALQTKPSP